MPIKTVEENLSVNMEKQSSSNLHIRKQQWLRTRNEKLAGILSGEESVKIDDFTIEIEGPEYGWLDITFTTEGQKPFSINASDVYPPFPNLRAWLEDLVHFTTIPSKSFVMDCENYKVLLSYDYLGVIEKDDILEPVALILLEDDIPEEEQKEDFGYSLMLIVPVRSFVSKLYYTLKNYMFTNRRVFSKNWNHPNGGDFDIRKLMRSFVSKNIEEVIKKMDEHTQDLGHWPLIRIK